MEPWTEYSAEEVLVPSGEYVCECKCVHTIIIMVYMHVLASVQV